MKRKAFFKFKLSDDYHEISNEYSNTVFTAILVVGKYIVSWEENGEKQETDYSKEDVEDALERGIWLFV